MGATPDANGGLTDRVLKAYSGIDDPRLRSLVLALIRHLHAYVGETKLTDQEWEFAWNFMGRMAAVPDRNEFLLAGDVLGVSQLIETLNHDRPGQSSASRWSGPFCAPMLHSANEGTRSPAMIRPAPGSAFPEKYLMSRMANPLQGPFWTCGRRRPTGFTRTRTIANPTTICGAGSRRIKTGATSSWRYCRRPIPFPPMARWENCCVSPRDGPTGRRISTSSRRSRITRRLSPRFSRKETIRPQATSSLPRAKTCSVTSRLTETSSAFNTTFL